MHRLPHGRVARIAAALALTAGLLAPAGMPAAGADPLVLRIGTVQNPDSINPWNAVLVVEYEIFQINYDLLVGFGDNAEPVPGFAESWTQSADGLTWTFKIRSGMKWSDGQPATAEDARWTIDYAIQANKAEVTLGLGYTQSYFVDAGIDEVSAPDAETLIVHTKYPTQRVLSMGSPILPKHIWQEQAPDKVGEFANDPPVVGTGPYQAVEWKTGQYIRFARNPNYWGSQGAADEVVMRFFPDAQDTMVQAFKADELDYIRGPSAQQFDQLKALPDVVAVAAESTGFEELGFNCYDKPIADGGASTKALQDPAFRAALGYAIDTQVLVDKVLHGYGSAGTTHVPPYYTQYHIEPKNLRTFDLATAAQKLDEAGYKLNADGQRLDKEGQPLNLRLYFPNTDPMYAAMAQFITDWFGQVGITVKSQAFDTGTLVDIQQAPEYDPDAKADYDLFIWGWLGDNGEPNTLLQIFLTSAIASAGTDSLYSNPRYDELYDEQNQAPTVEARAAAMAEMQQLIYDEAPYHVLVYDAELHVYRTDKFANWQRQPAETGTPFFVMGNLHYTLLTDATAVPSPTPAPTAAETAAPTGAASQEPQPTVAPSVAPSPTPAPSGGGDAGGDSTLLLAGGAVILVAILAVGLIVWRRGRTGGPRAEEE